MTIKYKVFYKFENEGKSLRVYRLDNQIILAVNDDTNPDEPAALDFEIPPREIAPLGRALVSVWEVIHPEGGDNDTAAKSEPMARDAALIEVLQYAILKIGEIINEPANIPILQKREILEGLSKYLTEAINEGS